VGLRWRIFPLASELEATLRRLNVTMGLGPAQGMLHLATRFLLGLGVVWLYAAIRPRFGAGPRTAMLAGVFMWIFTLVFWTVLSYPYGLYSAYVRTIMLVWGFFEMQLVAQAGAWLYRE